MEVIAFFESCVQWLIDWWSAGGKETIVAIVTSTPFITLAIKLLFAYLKRRKEVKQRHQKAESDEQAAIEADKAAFLRVVLKELPKHD